jgi:hypothetical protein
LNVIVTTAMTGVILIFDSSEHLKMEVEVEVPL